MKRRDIIKKLKAGVKVSVISRQREIDEQIVRDIERQTGVKLK